MVYTGKPSRGCGMCKSRRIKCDEKRASCGNCVKSGRVCPGYPSDFDLVFRDENKAMAKKRRAPGHTKYIPTDSTMSLCRERSLNNEYDLNANNVDLILPEVTNIEPRRGFDRIPPAPAFSVAPSTLNLTKFDFRPFTWQARNPISPSITLAPDHEAVAFFFKNFITHNKDAESARGFVELLTPVYSLARPSSVLHLATAAVALAIRGQDPTRRKLHRHAVSTYGKAIKKLHEDLKDPIQSRSDDTLLAILIFSLYEAIMSTDNTNTAWSNHVDGAVMLTKMRGMDQFQNPLSHAIFRAVRTMMITNCVQRSKPIESFPGTQGWLGTGNNSDENAANRLTLICIDLPTLRAQAKTLLDTSYSTRGESEAKRIHGFAERVDTELDGWYTKLSADYKHRIIGVESTIPTPENIATSARWPGEQHVYSDVPLANILNDYRVCRIFCRRVMTACIDWIHSGNVAVDTSSCETSLRIIQQMVDEISACVPFYMNYDLQPAAKEMNQDQRAAEAFGQYSLVWPLYVSAHTDIISPAQRAWLFGRLACIGFLFRLSVADMLIVARRHILTCGPIFP